MEMKGESRLREVGYVDSEQMDACRPTEHSTNKTTRDG